MMILFKRGIVAMLFIINLSIELFVAIEKANLIIVDKSLERWY